MDWLMPADMEVPLLETAARVYKQRSEQFGKGRPSERCLPHGIPDAMVTSNMKIQQSSRLTLILFEEFNHYRQVFTDGRSHPQGDPQPTWLGYSIGRWEGDIFVVDTMGFNDQTWLDDDGLPHSDALRTTERFRRLDFGHMEVEVTFTDPKTFSRPWSVRLPFLLMPDTELIENICENERDAARIVGKE
jgi:hypothetical protein